MNNAVLAQRSANSKMSEKTGLKKEETFFYASNVKRRLRVDVREKTFTDLVKICSAIGIEKFEKSLVLEMINSKQSKKAIGNYLSLMLNNTN